MTIDQVAVLLSKGPAPDWVVAELNRFSDLVAIEGQADDAVDRRILDSAVQLQRLLPLYITHVYEKIGEEYPACFDKVCDGLEELIDIFARQIELPRRGPKLDQSRHLCAAVCGWIWSEIHHRPQPHSPKLWEACEAYWVACGRQPSATGHIKSWEDFLLKNHPLITAE
jgi:hypothetical protein